MGGGIIIRLRAKLTDAIRELENDPLVLPTLGHDMSRAFLAVRKCEAELLYEASFIHSSLTPGTGT